jgi:hypothetical protein
VEGRFHGKLQFLLKTLFHTVYDVRK